MGPKPVTGALIKDTHRRETLALQRLELGRHKPRHTRRCHKLGEASKCLPLGPQEECGHVDTLILDSGLQNRKRRNVRYFKPSLWLFGTLINVHLEILMSVYVPLTSFHDFLTPLP